MSVAAQLHDHYRDVRKRLMGKPPARAKQPELTIIRITLTDAQKRSLKAKLSASNDNAYVLVSKMFPAECALIRRTCEGTRVTIKDIISEDQTHRVLAIRDKCLEAVHKAFPDLNLSDLGLLFQRDRSTITTAFERLGMKYVSARRGNLTVSQVEEILRFKNTTYAEIGALYGVSQNVIQNVRSGRYNPRSD